MPELPSTSLVPAASVGDVLALERALVVDLRSPGEFAEDHLPGAVNVPLLDDAGRALVGYLYARESPEAAFEKGREQIASRITDLVGRVGELAGWEPPAVDLPSLVRELSSGGIGRAEEVFRSEPAARLPERPVVLHCWRGGLRSCSVIALLRTLGLDRAVGLRGGYKAYRRFAHDQLNDWSPEPAVALRGLTGVGKTLVLRALEAQRPGWTLDLEGCAGHRSSLLGMVGLEPVPQKTFESRLAARLRERADAAQAEGVERLPLVLEGESRKVGDAIVPGTIWSSLQDARNVHLVAPVERRVQVLMEDYLARPEALPLLREQLGQVGARMGERFDPVGLFDAGRTEELVAELLEHYYDPLYLHSEKGRGYDLELDASDPEACAAAVVAWVEGGA